MPAPHPTRNLWLPTLLVVLALLGGLAVRLRMLPEVLDAPLLHLYEADPYLHLRRATLLWQGAPGLGYTDTFQDFPDTQVCGQLPVGFAALMAAVGHAAPGTDAATRIATAGLIAVPLLGLLGVVLAWRLARRRSHGLPLLLLAAVALLPITVDSSFASRMDHHVLDLLAVVAMLLAYSGAQRSWLRAGLFAGLAGAAALVSYPSALVTVTLTLAAAPVAALVAAVSGAAVRPLARAGAVAGATTGVLGLAFLYGVTPCAGGATLLANTWLPPTLSLIVGAVALLVLVSVPDALTLAQKRQRTLGLVFAGVLVPAALLLLPAVQSWLQVLQGRFAGLLTPEWAPLWRTSMSGWTARLSLLAYLIPLGWLLLARTALRPGANLTDRLLAAHVWLIAPAFVVQAKYFSHLSAFALCLGMVAAVEFAQDWAAQGSPLLRGFARGHWLLTLPLLAVEPGIHLAVKHELVSLAPVAEVLTWMRSNTPTVDRDRPAYGVLSLWSNGFWIAGLAERPNYANNFVAAPDDSIYVRHILESFAWLYGSDGAALDRHMQDQRLQYLLATPTEAHELRAFQLTAKQPIADLLTGPPEDPQSTFGPAFSRSVLVRLMLGQGAASPDAPCLDHLQLVATSHATLSLGQQKPPAVQLYRRVPGATLQLTGLKPGLAVRVGMMRRSDHFQFAVQCQTVADAQGRASLRFAYPSAPTGQFAPGSPLLLWLGDQQQPTSHELAAEAVEAGHDVVLVP